MALIVTEDMTHQLSDDLASLGLPVAIVFVVSLDDSSRSTNGSCVYGTTTSGGAAQTAHPLVHGERPDLLRRVAARFALGERHTRRCT